MLAVLCAFAILFVILILATIYYIVICDNEKDYLVLFAFIMYELLAIICLFITCSFINVLI